MNHRSTTMVSFLALFFACCAGIALAKETATIQLPANYEDDLYHCEDPTNIENIIPCDPTTYHWDLDALDTWEKPDDSLLCGEVVKILARAMEEEEIQLQQTQTLQDVQLWESIMASSVVDQLEPCVLWAVSYGSLAQWSSKMGLNGQHHHQQHNEQHDHVEINDNSDPISSLLEVDFDPIVIALAWNTDLAEPLSLDRTEFHDLTGRHMLGALKAELGDDKVEYLDLTVTAGLPDYDTKILPLTLSGRVVFGDHRQALGPSSLHRVLLQNAFVNDNARDLYLFRLKIAEDSTLQDVSLVLAGRDAVTDYILQKPKRDSNNNNNDSKSNGSQQFFDTSSMDLSEENKGFVWILLVAILSAVGVAIIAVVCFAYFLIFRTTTSGHAAKTLEEHGPSSELELEPAYRLGHPKDDNSNKKQKHSDKSRLYNTAGAYQDTVPAVQTAPTDELIEEGEDYDIEYVAERTDDGVSDYDMDTLPPPSTLPDSDDDLEAMSVMEGFRDQNEVPFVDDEETGTAGLSDDSIISDANTSLYEYIPDDTSLSMSPKKETVLEKVQKKGLLWSVKKEIVPSDTYSEKGLLLPLMKQGKAPSDVGTESVYTDSVYTESDDYDGSKLSTEQSYNKAKLRTSMLGDSSDNDSQSCDSNRLLYGTDDDDTNLLQGSHRSTESHHSYNEGQQQAQEQNQQQPLVEGSTTEQEIGDKKNRFEDLWKDDNEIDEAASVLNYLDSVQAVRRSAEAETEILPTSSSDTLKIVDVATPFTPERPLRGDSKSLESSNQQSSEAIVDHVPVMLYAAAGGLGLMKLPTPTKVDANLQESSSVSSNASGSGHTKSSRYSGESARKKNSKKWVPSSPMAASSESSVCSTDSAKFRSLLGQTDTNDAAIVFGNPMPQKPKDDNSTSTSSSNSTPEVDVSMSSCTSGKLESLLITTDSRDAASDDDSEDLLFDNGIPDPSRRSREEEKKDNDFDEGNRKKNYASMPMPASVTPRRPVALTELCLDSPDDSTVYSAFSEAPSVDESIATGMGWF